MKAFIGVNLEKPKSLEALKEVAEKLNENGITVLMDIKNKPICDLFTISAVFDNLEDNISRCDIFITIGGDGTILRWGKRAAAVNKPLLGINTGRLGFMATLERDQLNRLSRLVSGEYSISRRMIIDVKIQRENGCETYEALNDAVLFKSSVSKLPEYVVECDGAEVSVFRADGVIISTPTGSTAYSLSAGGPIIDPKMKCFELTSLSPHTLFSRPMIFSADSTLTARYIGYEKSKVSVTIDGGESIGLSERDKIIFTKSQLELQLIDLEENSFYNSIHNKLMKPLKQ